MATKKKAAATKTEPAVETPRERVVPTREQISARALAIYRAGGTDSVGNWLQAERELNDELNR
jgi:hypothetical protein